MLNDHPAGTTIHSVLWDLAALSKNWSEIRVAMKVSTRHDKLPPKPIKAYRSQSVKPLPQQRFKHNPSNGLKSAHTGRPLAACCGSSTPAL
jgi:hypothetical protein